MGPWPLPRIPTSSSISLLPIPLHGLLLRSYGGGWGGKDNPIDWVVKGPAVSCPIPKKTIVMVMVKGPWSLGPCAPSFSMHYMCKTACSNKERQSLEGIADQGQNQDRREEQRPRGVFRVWVPGWHTHIQQIRPANPKPRDCPKTGYLSTIKECDTFCLPGPPPPPPGVGLE